MSKSFASELHGALYEFAAPNAGHGNDREWKAWKAMKPAFHPYHSPWKSLWDSHIPTASTTRFMFCFTDQPESSPPQGACNGCLRSTT
jgi:hypothetical protein